MKYLLLVIFMFFLVGCFENVRQSVGVSTNPFSKNVNEKTKFNYKIIFGKVRPKEDNDD